MRPALPILMAGCIALFQAASIFAQDALSPEAIREGHWVEIRGGLNAAGEFEARRIEIVHSQRYEVLIGTVQSSEKENHIRVLGRDIELHEKTELDRISRDELTGARVKVEGYFRNAELFSAREISPRGEGRDRLVGRADRVRRSRNRVLLEVMNFTVSVPVNLELRLEDPLPEYTLSQRRTQPVMRESRNEDDQFGKGIRIAENMLFAGLVEARWTGEDEFDLDRRDPEDRQDSESSFRGRFIYRPSPGFAGVVEVSHRRLWRNDDEDGRVERDNTVLGETYGYWFDPFRSGTDFQLGRMDFDDDREWLYDQNLDGLRIFQYWRDLVIELSLTTTLSDGSPLDEDTLNTVLYVWNGDEEEHIAAYVIHRDTDIGTTSQSDFSRTHYGLRMHGEFLENHLSWAELAYMDGRAGGTSASGWAVDLGNTWIFDNGLSFTLGYALAQGDDPKSATDNAFRQTGLQDNNARFAGVTSFRYYGELADPELSNLQIATAGVGFLLRPRISLDLVGHHYRQHELSRRLTDFEIDKRPNGRDRDLGWEADLILGWRTHPDWDFEMVAAWFEPGAAFDDADTALLGKVQLRYRF